jgi:transposase
MSQPIDRVRNSLPSSNDLVLGSVEETNDGIVFRAPTKRQPRCPACLQSRVSYHSRYVSRMRDLPFQGRRIEIHLQTRRFRCRNTACRRKIFAEQLPAVAGPNARETVVRDTGFGRICAQRATGRRGGRIHLYSRQARALNRTQNG